MAILLDTNILLRLTQPHHPGSRVAAQALRSLRANGEVLHITQQNLVEFWAVATRPIAVNGLGLSADEAATELEALKQFFYLLPEVPIHDAWERLVRSYSVSGKSSHDARLVAAMLVHGIESILTFNAQDFLRYDEIRVLDVSKIG